MGLVVTAALGYVYRDEVDKAVKDGLKKGLQAYGNDSVYTHEVDFMQSHVSSTLNDVYIHERLVQSFFL